MQEKQTDKAVLRITEDGFLEVVYQSNAEINLEDAQQTVAAGKTLLGDREPVPHLIDISHTRSMSRETRAYYGTEAANELVSFGALIAKSKVARVIGNFFMGLNRPCRPFKLFTSRESAVEWLKQKSAE